jgi:methyltransferase (TIGR00027 family)
MSSSPSISDVSDTARWVAVYRARETERPDAVFRDPFARRLAGERGEALHRTLGGSVSEEWAFVARTYLFDDLIAREIAAGADLVLNLAAGLDARPYRLPLPPTLQWVEVDFPAMLAYKTEVLADERPRCRLERLPLDLSDVDARRALLRDVSRRAQRIVVITEGLLIYLEREQVAELSRDLAASPHVRRWVLDIASPGLLALMQQRLNAELSKGNAPLRFGPPEGPPFFIPFGWRPWKVRSLLKTAAKLGRLPPLMRLIALLPDSSGRQGRRPWSAVCLMGRS